MTIITLSKTRETLDKHQCPICNIVMKTKYLFLSHGHFRVYWESLATLPGPKFNSEHGKGVERTGRSDLLVRTPAYYCWEDKEATNEHVAALKWKWEDVLTFWIELDLNYRQLLALLRFFMRQRWILAIKEQTDSGSKSVQINQYYILWVLRSQSIPDQS